MFGVHCHGEMQIEASRKRRPAANIIYEQLGGLIQRLHRANTTWPIHAATACDGRFLLTGDSGVFQADRYPRPDESGVVCRWIIR